MSFLLGSRRARRFASVLSVVSLSVAASLSSGCRAQAPWPLWDSYAARYMDNQGRVIDHSRNDLTTTEGEAYAMFFALVAGDRNKFEKLLAWTEANMAQGDLTTHLPAWSWGKASDGGWHALDTNSASDADLWMAYTLCEAGRLWHSDRYTKLGEILAARIAREEIVLVPSVGSVLLPGPQGFHPSDGVYFVNPSYAPPALLAYFAHRMPDAPWAQVLASLPQVVQTSGGFAMDWMQATPAGMLPSAPPSVVAGLSQGQGSPTPVGSYDAIRVYLWAGIADPHTPHVRDTITALAGMTRLLNTGAMPPAQVGPEGQLIDPAGPVGFSAAAVPFLEAGGHRTAARLQTDRVNTMRDSATGLYGPGALYFDQNLVLFAQGWGEGRYSFGPDGSLRLKWK